MAMKKNALPVNEYTSSSEDPVKRDRRLQEEIRFWEFMIERCKRNGYHEEIPRLTEALALAEYQLLMLRETGKKNIRH